MSDETTNTGAESPAQSDVAPPDPPPAAPSSPMTTTTDAIQIAPLPPPNTTLIGIEFRSRNDEGLIRR